MEPADTTVDTTRETSAGSMSPASSGSAFVRVAAIMPFFRYAVGPTSQHSPAIPYFTRRGAEACFADVVRELPWCGAIMYRRTWRGLVTLREYRPNDGGEGRPASGRTSPPHGSPGGPTCGQ